MDTDWHGSILLIRGHPRLVFPRRPLRSLRETLYAAIFIGPVPASAENWAAMVSPLPPMPNWTVNAAHAAPTLWPRWPKIMYCTALDPAGIVASVKLRAPEVPTNVNPLSPASFRLTVHTAPPA